MDYRRGIIEIVPLNRRQRSNGRCLTCAKTSTAKSIQIRIQVLAAAHSTVSTLTGLICLFMETALEKDMASNSQPLNQYKCMGKTKMVSIY